MCWKPAPSCTAARPPTSSTTPRSWKAISAAERISATAAGAAPEKRALFSILRKSGKEDGDSNFIFRAKRAHAALGRPRPTGRAGLSADAVPLDGILIGPDVNELVQPTQFACPACRQWR